MMNLASLVFTIAIITTGIVDLCLVVFGGTGTSISNFLINLGFKDPVIVFTLGFVAGHLFGYMKPVPVKKYLLVIKSKLASKI